MTDTTITRVRRVLVDILDADPMMVVSEATLEGLGADSLDSVQIVNEVEEEFGIKVPDEVLPNLNTVGDLVRVVEALRK